MTRRKWFLLPLLLTACRPAPRDADSLLPAAVADVWHRTSLREIPPPEPRVRRALEATYDGPGKLTAEVDELPNSGVGMDMVQRRKPQADTVFFYQDRYFVVVKWGQADRKDLTAFVRALEKSMAPDARP